MPLFTVAPLDEFPPGSVKIVNAAVPFLLYAYAAQSLGAGFLSVANAVTPVWGAVIGWLWLGERLAWTRSLGLMIGVQVSDMTVGTTIANLGMTDVRFPNPLFEGDTVHCQTTVVSKRESKSRPNAGIVEFHHQTFKQDGKLVAECHRNAFIVKRPK